MNAFRSSQMSIDIFMNYLLKDFFIKNGTNMQWFLYIQTNSFTFDTITSLKNSIPGDNFKIRNEKLATTKFHL